jgi:hypothetical protein
MICSRAFVPFWERREVGGHGSRCLYLSSLAKTVCGVGVIAFTVPTLSVERETVFAVAVRGCDIGLRVRCPSVTELIISHPKPRYV